MPHHPGHWKGAHRNTLKVKIVAFNPQTQTHILNSDSAGGVRRNLASEDRRRRRRRRAPPALAPPTPPFAYFCIRIIKALP
ncbi:hypothetical protein EVAR_66485_1 [Eumeta japonica]|uniref:Uncharacterized protein n=1 Tax=Eumeta variegata TaxID=151549 RepID=A0A4C2A183_EUMVA|nr:hypothetical protein EVAR_66485_1 [Eumeta japonica]